jgi:hypothetical protein
MVKRLSSALVRTNDDGEPVEFYFRAHETFRASSMQAFTSRATRPFEPVVRSAQWNSMKRRLCLRARSFGKAAASCFAGARTGLFKALHDSRSLLAARVIDQHRHLIQDPRDAGDPGRGKITCEAKVSNSDRRSNDSMSWRLYFLFTILVIVFATAHVLALQKLNATQSERPPATIDFLAD